MDPDITTRCSNVWWTIYVIDQELTAGLGCPPTIPLNSITMPLPDIQSLSMPTKALALRSRLSQINSMIYSSTLALFMCLSDSHLLEILADYIHSLQLFTVLTTTRDLTLFPVSPRFYISWPRSRVR